MDEKNGPKEAMPVRPPVAPNSLGVNVFTAPGKAMVGERPKPFGEPLGFDPITSTSDLWRARRSTGGRDEDGG